MIHAVWPLVAALAAQAPPPAAVRPELVPVLAARALDQRPAPSDPDEQSENALAQMLHTFGRGLKKLPSRSTVGILGVGGAASLAAHGVDKQVHTWAVTQPESPVASFGNAAGDIWAQGSGALVTWIGGLIAHNDTVTTLGRDLICAQAINGLLVVPTKALVNRNRPTGGRYSFPSGHTSATAATATVLQLHFGWRAGIPAYALTALTGWARLRSDQHWLSDVAFGATIGVIAARAVTAGSHRSWVVVPVKTKGGVALFVAR